MRHPLVSRPTTRVAAALLCVTAGLVAAGLGSAEAAGPQPVRIQIDAITGIDPPDGTPPTAVPTVLVEASEPGDVPAPEEVFSVEVSFWGQTQPASFASDTPLTITSPQGAVFVLNGTAPADATSAVLTATMKAPVNQVVLTVDDVAGARTARAVASDTSTNAQRFDVVEDLRLENSAVDVALTEGIGGDDSVCTAPSRAVPVCGVAVLPRGAVSSQVLLSVGACDAAYAACGSNAGSVVQLLADLDRVVSTPDGPEVENLYTKSAPATIVMKCDKTLCGKGAIQKQFLNYSLAGNQELVRVPACAAKNTIGGGQEVCLDYVQSKRDGSGDTYLYFLFTRDARVSVG